MAESGTGAPKVVGARVAMPACQVQQLLGFTYFEQVHQFFKEHDVYLHYSMEDLEHDLAEARRFAALKENAPEHRAG